MIGGLPPETAAAIVTVAIHWLEAIAGSILLALVAAGLLWWLSYRVGPRGRVAMRLVAALLFAAALAGIAWLAAILSQL